jgi:hypothetical protein
MASQTYGGQLLEEPVMLQSLCLGDFSEKQHKQLSFTQL